MKITYHAAISADGFIAREDGDVSWLDDVKIEGSEAYLEELFADVDGLVMGRGTYDFVFNYGSWPYEDKLSWVFTSRQLQALEGANLHLVKSIGEFMDDAAARNTRHVWLIGGGQLASAFLDNGLPIEVNMSELPVTLGSGIPVFSEHSFAAMLEGDAKVTQMNGYRKIEMSL